MRVCLFLLLIACIFILTGCYSESPIENKNYGIIKGKVVDKYGSDPIGDALIKLSSEYKICFSDTLGEFLINGIKPGNYIITAEAENFKTDSVTQIIEAGQTYEISFELFYKTSTVSKPKLNSPQNKLFYAETNMSFYWTSCTSSSQSPITYDFYIDTTNVFKEKIVSLQNPSYQYSNLKYNTKYYWQVKAVDLEGNSKASEISTFTTKPQSPIQYVVEPPEGKLPYPQHDPNFTQQEYDDMVNNVFLINNFGQDQFSYLHDGLDFVIPNGTKIFAVDSGYVSEIGGGNQYYRTLVIIDKNNSDYAWSYTHINSFNVRVGDFVEQGQYLAVVNFQGVEHIHLERLKRNESGSLKIVNSYSIHPDKYFYYLDTKAPLVKTPFYYFTNNSNEIFSTSEINGEVDIVVAAREIGEYAKGKISPSSSPNFGDRLAVAKLNYTIESPDGKLFSYNSFDLTNIYISKSHKMESDRLIYKDYKIIEGNNRMTSGWSDYYSYYIITNHKANDELQPLDITNGSLAWKTNEKNGDGTPKYPNGEYKISVTAYDFMGNYTTVEDVVTVNN